MKNKRYGVAHEPTCGLDIWEGWYDSLQAAIDYAMKCHYGWCAHWNKALYLVDSETNEHIYLVRGNR